MVKKLKIVREDLREKNQTESQETLLNELEGILGRVENAYAYNEKRKSKKVSVGQYSQVDFFLNRYWVKRGLFNKIAKIEFWYWKEEIHALITTTSLYLSAVKRVCEDDKTDLNIEVRIVKIVKEL